MPTEYGANQYVNELYNVQATIDGIELSGITALNIKHKVNSARIVTITLESRQGLEMMRVGGIIKLNFGLSDAYANKIINYEEGTLLGLTGYSVPNNFYGRVKVIRPSLTSSTITAMDLVSDLATSQIENIQWRDYGSQDKYMVGKDICDYAGIDISLLNESMKYDEGVSNGKLDPDENIYGYQTRKSFLDKLFETMAFNPNDTVTYQSASTPSVSYMSKSNPFVEFYYAIKQGKTMEFFAPNRFDKRARPVLKIGTNEANIIGDGLVGQIDSSSIINSITLVSSNDDTKKVTLQDNTSIQKHGVYAKNISFNSSDTNAMKEAGYLILQKFKEPTNTYKVELAGGEWLQLGDLIEISSPLMASSELFPVIEKQISITDSVVTKIAVGSRSISTKKILELVQR